MKIYEATNKGIQELHKKRRLSEYALIYQAAMPPSTMESTPYGKSTDPGIVNIKKVAEGLGVTTREFHDSEIFNDPEQED